MQRLGVAGRQIGAPGAADQQRITGDDTVHGEQAHRVRGVARRVQRLQAKIADAQNFPVSEAKGRIGRRRGAVHDHGDRQKLAHGAAAGEMVGMGVGVGDIMQA